MKPTLTHLMGLLALSLTPAMAAPIQVWNFSGTCIDCPGLGTGTLTVEATEFTFSYTSAWLTFSMANATVQLNNVLQTPGVALPDPSNQQVRIQGMTAVTSFGGTNGIYSNPLPIGTANRNMVFDTDGNIDFWGLGDSQLSDYGTAPTWTPGSVPTSVPEPSTFALLASAAVASGLVRRRLAR